MSDNEYVVILNERTRLGGETGAGVMRNRCAFTPRDMGADWPEAFTYAVVAGWDDAMEQMATRWEWDPALVEFLQDAHRRFQELPDRNESTSMTAQNGALGVTLATPSVSASSPHWGPRTPARHPQARTAAYRGLAMGSEVEVTAADREKALEVVEKIAGVPWDVFSDAEWKWVGHVAQALAEVRET